MRLREKEGGKIERKGKRNELVRVKKMKEKCLKKKTIIATPPRRRYLLAAADDLISEKWLDLGLTAAAGDDSRRGAFAFFLDRCGA